MSLIKFELVTKCKDCDFSVVNQSCSEIEPSLGLLNSISHLQFFPTHTLTYSGGMSGTKRFVTSVQKRQAEKVASRAAEGEE